MPSPREIEIRECTLSKAGENFGANNVAESDVDDFGQLPVEDQLDAFQRARSWCEGILDAITINDLTEEEIEDLFNNIESKINSGQDLGDDQINQRRPDLSTDSGEES